MKRSSFLKRVSVLRDKLGHIPPDTAWIIQPENRRYLSGFKATDSQLNESSGSLLINDKKAMLITDSRYTIEAQKDAPDFQVVTLKKGLMESLPELLGRLKTKNLGFEEDFLIWGLHRQLAKKMKKLSPPMRLTPLNGLVDGMREIKDRAEIGKMKASAHLMSDILGEVIEGLKPGRTEMEVAWEIEGLAREAGAEDLA
ncbi:MAG: aminopeptidase P family N-terminal domain-containing protein, partial [Deltaproteobacteria bacterium]|nr:aminopeptidase P family N-terminal domain-containing protein [Deltaproteobacteria bacterium]